MKEFILPTIKAEQNPLTILGPAGEIFEFIRTGKSTNGKYVISKTVVPSGVGPAPHVHNATDEWFYAPDGGIVLFMGKNKYSDVNVEAGDGAQKEVLYTKNMGKGELIYVPRHYMHAFINNTNESQLLYMIWTPDTEDVSILNYFKEVGQLITNTNHIPVVEPLAKLRFVSEAPRFGINQSNNFWQYVKKVDYSQITMDDNQDELLRLINSGEVS